jgi:hypothetical protein
MCLRSTYWIAVAALRGTLLTASALDRVIPAKDHLPFGAKCVTNKRRKICLAARSDQRTWFKM